MFHIWSAFSPVWGPQVKLRFALVLLAENSKHYIWIRSWEVKFWNQIAYHLYFLTRFNFFIDKVLPEYRDAIMTHTLIYVPSYFDYVRLRNYFKKEELNFAHICEYSSKSGICRARHLFLSGEKQFLIITERFHFYKRWVALT